MNYDTKQKKIILETLLKNSDKHLSIQELLEILKSQNVEVSQATVYRYLDTLVEKELVRKIVSDHNHAACYQINDNKCNHNHFHLICKKCGKLFHLDCDETAEFVEHINKEHDFEIDLDKVVFYGVCKDCK